MDFLRPGGGPPCVGTQMLSEEYLHSEEYHHYHHHHQASSFYESSDDTAAESRRRSISAYDTIPASVAAYIGCDPFASPFQFPRAPTEVPLNSSSSSNGTSNANKRRRFTIAGTDGVKYSLTGKRIGRPRIDREHTRCSECYTSSTPQWRYLTREEYATRPVSATPKRKATGATVGPDARGKIPLCNACWLRTHKARQRLKQMRDRGSATRRRVSSSAGSGSPVTTPPPAPEYGYWDLNGPYTGRGPSSDPSEVDFVQSPSSSSPSSRTFGLSSSSPPQILAEIGGGGSLVYGGGQAQAGSFYLRHLPDGNAGLLLVEPAQPPPVQLSPLVLSSESGDTNVQLPRTSLSGDYVLADPSHASASSRRAMSLGSSSPSVKAGGSISPTTASVSFPYDHTSFLPPYGGLSSSWLGCTPV